MEVGTGEAIIVSMQQLLVCMCLCKNYVYNIMSINK